MMLFLNPFDPSLGTSNKWEYRANRGWTQETNVSGDAPVPTGRGGCGHREMKRDRLAETPSACWTACTTAACLGTTAHFTNG
jgi:hypothetical protein